MIREMPFMPCTPNQEADICRIVESICQMFPPAAITSIVDRDYRYGCRVQTRAVQRQDLTHFPGMVSSALRRGGYEVSGYSSFFNPGGEAFVFDVVCP